MILHVIAVLLALTTSAAAIECRSAPPKPAKEYWSWRQIDGRQCWYAGQPGLDKAKLHWATNGVPPRPEPKPVAPPPVEAPLPAPAPPPQERTAAAPEPEPIATSGKGDRQPLTVDYAVVEQADAIVIPPPLQPKPQQPPPSFPREAAIIALLTLAAGACLYLATVVNRQTKWIG